MHGTRTQDLFQKRQLRSSGPEWHYTVLERNGPETMTDGSDNPSYNERLEAPAGLGAHVPQAAGRIRPASAASSRGKSETKRPRPQTARQFRDNKTKARKTPSYLKGTESSKLKDTSLSSTSLSSTSLSLSARPSHKPQRTGSRLLDKQQSKPASRSSARSARPQSAPLGGRTAGTSSRNGEHLRYSTSTPAPRCPFAQLQQDMHNDVHTMLMDQTLSKALKSQMVKIRPDGVLETRDHGRNMHRGDHKKSSRVADSRSSKKHLWDLHREAGKTKSPWQNGKWVGVTESRHDVIK